MPALVTRAHSLAITCATAPGRTNSRHQRSRHGTMGPGLGLIDTPEAVQPFLSNCIGFVGWSSLIAILDHCKQFLCDLRAFVVQQRPPVHSPPPVAAAAP